jgi:hypothetical protein
MGLLKRQFDLANESDRREVLDALQSSRITLKPCHINFALNHQSKHWFKLNSMDYCHLPTEKGDCGIELVRWVRTLQALYEFRNHPGLKEQMRRLCLRSHEPLDTMLVLRVAMRYQQRGFDVAFEPNGEGCSDLRVVRNSDVMFIEVKRENTGEHKRHKRVYSVGPRISRVLLIKDPRNRLVRM